MEQKNPDQLSDDGEKITKDPQSTVKKESDTQVLIDHQKKLMTYKNNLYKLDALISLEKDQSTQEELLSMRGDLLQAISYQEDVIKFTQNSDEYFFSVERLTSDHVGWVGKVYNDNDSKWYNAEIMTVDVEQQESEIYFIGFKENRIVSSVFVKLFQLQNPAAFQPGTYCDAIYSGDGNFFPCVIEKLDEEGFHVKFKKYNNKEIKKLSYLRESRSQPGDLSGKKRQFEDLDELKIPDYLKIQPNDSEQQRQQKRKKVKAIKQSFRQAQLERDNKVKQTHWQSFLSVSQKNKKGYFQNAKESIFRSPDSIDGKVGVMNSGKAMTQFGETPKTRSDVAHLNRLY